MRQVSSITPEEDGYVGENCLADVMFWDELGIIWASFGHGIDLLVCQRMLAKMFLEWHCPNMVTSMTTNPFKMTQYTASQFANLGKQLISALGFLFPICGDAFIKW